MVLISNALLILPTATVSTVTELRQTALTSVMVQWTPPPGAVVTGFTVRYRITMSGNGSDGAMPVSQDSTNTEISGLVTGGTYIFTVEASASNMLPGVSEEMSITLGEWCQLVHSRHSYFSPSMQVQTLLKVWWLLQNHPQSQCPGGQWRMLTDT